MCSELADRPVIATYAGLRLQLRPGKLLDPFQRRASRRRHAGRDSLDRIDGFDFDGAVRHQGDGRTMRIDA